MKELRELFQYVDRCGIPSKAGRDPGTPYPDEDAVLVAVPSRVLCVLRAVVDAADAPGPFGGTSSLVAELARERNRMRQVIELLDEILKLAFKHETQYWLDVPGTDEEKLRRILRIGQDALAVAKES